MLRLSYLPLSVSPFPFPLLRATTLILRSEPVVVSVRTSSGYSFLPLLLCVVTSSACFTDQYCFVWSGGMGSGLALSSTLSSEAVVGREELSSRRIR